MKNKRKLTLLALVAVPSLIYTAPTTSASAADITGHTKTAYIYDYTYYYNSNVSNVVRLISNINDTTASFQEALEAATKAYDELTETEKQYVTNYSTLSNHRQTRVAYRKLQ
jgi:cobalamin-dependent methionine synthase I